jgi:site-specific recombinase XerD
MGPYGSNPATCPMRARRTWLEASGITEGAAFRAITRHDKLSTRRLTAEAVAAVVKRRAKAAGFHEKAFAGHSLRAGFATEAFRQGVPELSVMRHGRWKSSASMRG